MNESSRLLSVGDGWSRGVVPGRPQEIIRALSENHPDRVALGCYVGVNQLAEGGRSSPTIRQGAHYLLRRGIARSYL
jgi:hypothetical protein